MPELRTAVGQPFRERRSSASGTVSTYARRATDRPARQSLLLDPGCSIEGVTINVPTLRVAHAEVVDRASRGSGFVLFTLNLDHLASLRSNSQFRAAYRRATLVTADGWPVVWLANRGKTGLRRTCGSDLVDPVCKSAAARGIPVFFIGPERKSQMAALSILKERYPTLKVVGFQAPRISKIPTRDEIEMAARRVNASGARLCFVCLGAPKQELLADALVPMCDLVGFLCVGAALDFISGHSRRAPLWLQRVGLEWLWRLLGDPKRFASRYLSSARVLFLLALRSRFERS